VFPIETQRGELAASSERGARRGSSRFPLSLFSLAARFSSLIRFWRRRLESCRTSCAHSLSAARASKTVQSSNPFTSRLADLLLDLPLFASPLSTFILRYHSTHLPSGFTAAIAVAHTHPGEEGQPATTRLHPLPEMNVTSRSFLLVQRSEASKSNPSFHSGVVLTLLPPPAPSLGGTETSAYVLARPKLPFRLFFERDIQLKPLNGLECYVALLHVDGKTPWTKVYGAGEGVQPPITSPWFLDGEFGGAYNSRVSCREFYISRKFTRPCTTQTTPRGDSLERSTRRSSSPSTSAA
jgi:hypothetical protein